MSKYPTLKPKCCHLLYILRTTELIHAGSKHLQILYDPGNSTGHWVCTYYDGNAINIYDCLNSHLHKDHNMLLK